MRTTAEVLHGLLTTLNDAWDAAAIAGARDASGLYTACTIVKAAIDTHQHEIDADRVNTLEASFQGLSLDEIMRESRRAGLTKLQACWLASRVLDVRHPLAELVAAYDQATINQ